MQLLQPYLGALISASLIASLPLSSRGGLLSQDPQSYGSRLMRDPVSAAERGSFAHPIDTQDEHAARGDTDPDLDDDDPDDDDLDDDEEDLIPGDLLEGDSDSGGESDTGNDAVSVANGLLGSGGAGSAALNNRTSGSTAVFCSLFACASAAQSDGKVSTSATGVSTIDARRGGPLVSVKGPLVVINVSRTSSVRKTLG
ncbi:hypothetical protein CCM_01482 [Cordyceps militaris CM01]|uniref:Uncharacterized protein n=1 Tax=Cordyceps militaris (strain CM01) TaxID=983644 RepID=G3J5B4_CORMM|nr:uncharacterized protein CCM_01482 [Cordyceps militaris CM01]EGX96824.1 hypothetical protein CCM_01482 [Cordyceps militaris CM01]